MIQLEAPSQIINADEKLTVHRTNQVTYVDGKPIQKNFEPYEMVCNIQPLNGRDLLLVPEGDRHKEQYYIFTEQNQETPQVNDMIVRNQVNFQVQSAENWGSFSRIRIMRVDVGNYATP